MLTYDRCGRTDYDEDAFPRHARALSQREGDAGPEATPALQRSEVVPPDADRPPESNEEEEGAWHHVAHHGAHLQAGDEARGRICGKARVVS